MRFILLITLLFSCSLTYSQSQAPNFRIRTITAGVNLKSLSDTTTIHEAITFLKAARRKYIEAGYEVQTIRIATQDFYYYSGAKSLSGAIPALKIIDQIAQREGMPISIGNILRADAYSNEIGTDALELIKATKNINFSLAISATGKGMYPNGIRAAAEITKTIAEVDEGNFRFTASANCPANIPFFPAAYHVGEKSFAVGLEYPNLLTHLFNNPSSVDARASLKSGLEDSFKPIESIAEVLSTSLSWKYDGIDTSPAPRLDASIGEAIESLTGQPFGSPMTLSGCSLITDVIKNLDVKSCGYSGLMLPVIEDKVLAKRAMEGKFTVQELLLFSSVSGTGLDVVPIPGSTSVAAIERVLIDVASLSLKYRNKALSARLFLVKDKEVGDKVEFDNPYLTSSVVMAIE